MKNTLLLILIVGLTSCLTQKRPIYYTYYKQLDSLGGEVIKYRFDNNYKDLFVLLQAQCYNWGQYCYYYSISLSRYTDMHSTNARAARFSNRFMKLGGKWLPVYIDEIDWPLTRGVTGDSNLLIMPLRGTYVGSLYTVTGEVNR